MVKVSIIVPLYNKAPYVIKALGSIASQTYKDWECNIVNDGSTDESVKVIGDWLKVNGERLEGKFRMIVQENAGVSAARNRGIAESKGEYVCFLDADDWWAPEFLQEMVQFAEEYPDAGLYASNYWYVRNGKEKIGVRTIENGYINYPQMYYTTGNMPVWTGAVMISRLKIEDCRLENGEVFPIGISLGEDFLLWARIAMQHPVAFLNKPLAYYNNDVLSTLRLTRNLHTPEKHMLWHFDDLTVNGEWLEVRGRDWKTLFDWLRVSGLKEYWIDVRYRELARLELNKVDWKKQPKREIYYYQMPMWYLRTRKCLLTIGSWIKQRLKK